jgi:hypothetical protein
VRKIQNLRLGSYRLRVWDVMDVSAGGFFRMWGSGCPAGRLPVAGDLGR